MLSREEELNLENFEEDVDEEEDDIVETTEPERDRPPIETSSRDDGAGDPERE